MKTRKPEPVEKKPYAAPAIRRVQLHPEESLTVGCKNVSTPGPGGDCVLSSCLLDGS